MRLADARKDQYRILAKEKGYRSRSAFKLIELNERYNLFRNSSTIIDIGCSPGGWLQVVSKYSRSSTRIIGVDINPTEPLKNITVLRRNIEDPKLAELLLEIAKSPFDLLLSDLSPNMSGIWDYDHARQVSISLYALELASKILRIGGDAVFKIFEGEMMNDFKVKLAVIFTKVIVCKPKASRQESSELYIICKNLQDNNETLRKKVIGR
jgi:23S rRNA (uridine2552-2'-O)-methyltransferase